MDECQLGACGYARHICTNTLGSFDCKCSPGFNIVDDASGEDKCEGNEFIIKDSVNSLPSYYIVLTCDEG